MLTLKTKINFLFEQTQSGRHESLVYDKLFSICLDIFNGVKDDDSCDCLGYEYGFHVHSLMTDLIARSCEGCKLCSLVLNSFKPILQAQPPILSPIQYFEDDGTHGFEHMDYSVCLKDALGDDSLDSKATVDHQKLLSIRVLPRQPVLGPRFAREYLVLVTPIGRRGTKNFQERLTSDQNTVRPSCLIQIESWLSSCLANHQACRMNWQVVLSDRTLPTRLLQIAQIKDTLQVRVTTTTHLPITTPYFTLSHCWGSKTLASLTTERETSYSEYFPHSSLPRTFQDAVEVTTSLGYEYLWIDSLCILQDSQSDWEHESSMMGRVYVNGILNIAATASENSAGGLFLPEAHSGTQPCFLRLEFDSHSSNFACHPSDPWTVNIENAPLSKRGWVVQERLLSPRVLHCASDQMYWECCATKHAELLPQDQLGNDRDLKSDGISTTWSRARVCEKWDQLVQKYTDYDLTFESDKLVAIAGLARKICRQLGVLETDYAAGLWKSNLIHDLLWRFADSEHRYKKVLDRAPSWSLASIDGIVIPLEPLEVQQSLLAMTSKFFALL